MVKKILVVDDEPNIRAMIKLALEFSGYEVVACQDGREGLEAFATQRPFDIVLLDYRMPGLNGQQVHEKIRETEPSQRVILLTAYATIELAMESMKAGAVGFLRKPFSADVLRRTVEQALTKKVEDSSALNVEDVLAPFIIAVDGFTFNLDHTEIDEKTQVRQFRFEVTDPHGKGVHVQVNVSPVVTELVKAQMDCEVLPGQEHFWNAFAESELAQYFSTHHVLPENNVLEIQDLSAATSKWLDEVLTLRVKTRLHHV